MPQRYANNATSTLGATITNVATTLTVASAATFPTAGDFALLVDSEIMKVTAVSGATFTVVRGQEGTAAAAHTAAVTVTSPLTALSLQNLYHVDVRAYGATGDGVADDTVAIQAAVTGAAGKHVYFPAGNYKITAAITFGTPGQVFSGDGMESSTVTLSGAINGFQSTSTYVRCTFRDMAIVGNSSTLDAIYLPSAGGDSYECAFENMKFYTGGRGVYAPLNFSTHFLNCQFSSYNNNGVEVFGGTATTFINCYAHNAPASFYGYRVYGGATFIGCNGVDSAANWGLFGQSVALDGVERYALCVFINCNFEAYTNRAVTFRGDDARASFVGCSFIPAATYDCSVYINATVNGMITFENTLWGSGVGRVKAAEVYHQGAASIFSIGINLLPAEYGANGTYNVANMDILYTAYLQYSTQFNSLSFLGDLLRDSTKVVGARVTGWAAATGTATRTTFVTSTVTLAQLAERVKALEDDLIAHGLIGT